MVGLSNLSLSHVGAELFYVRLDCFDCAFVGLFCRSCASDNPPGPVKICNRTGPGSEFDPPLSDGFDDRGQEMNVLGLPDAPERSDLPPGIRQANRTPDPI